MLRPCFALLSVMVAAAAAFPQDAPRFSRSGVSFDHPKDWKATTENLYGLTAVTVKSPRGSQATLQLHPRGTNPVGARIQHERSLLQAHEGKLVEGSDQPVKRSFSPGEQEGAALAFKGDDGEVVAYELYAFTLPGKKELVCLVTFQHPARDAEAAKKAFGLLAATLTEEGAPRPGTKAAPTTPAVRLNVPVPAGWELLPAKKGGKLWEDRFYEFTQLPKELEGGQLLLRNVDDAKAWLPEERVRVLRDCTVYAILRTKYLGAVVVDDATLRQMGRDGWREVPEGAKSSFPSGENWGWRVIKRALKKDEDFPPLRGMTLGHPVVFVFK